MGEGLREGGVGRGAGGAQRKESRWESCTRSTITQRALLWQLLEMFPHGHLLCSCSFFPPSGEETLLKPRWSLSSGSAWSQLDPVLVPSPSPPLLHPSRPPGSFQLGWQFFLPQEDPGPVGGEEPPHSAPGTAESVLLHGTTIMKPTTTRDLCQVPSFSRQRLFLKSRRQRQSRDRPAARAAKTMQEEPSSPSGIVGMAPAAAG